jgi:hypothetical protein
MLLKKHYPILLSSDVLDGAININSDGSSFDASLDQEDIIIPKDAKNCNIFVQDAEFIYSFPNILTGVNDLITITYNDGINPLFTYNLVIPQGLYSINDLDNALKVELLNQPGYPVSSPLIEFIGSDPTQKVLIKYNYSGVRVDLTGSQTFREIIGFNSNLYPLAGVSTINTFDTAENVAKFNTVRYVTLACSLVDNGMRIGNRYDFYVARILINVEVGQQQIYSPQIKTAIPANNLIGKKLNKTRIRMLDQNGNSVNTNNEFFSLNLVIEYEIIIDE